MLASSTLDPSLDERRTLEEPSTALPRYVPSPSTLRSSTHATPPHSTHSEPSLEPFSKSSSAPPSVSPRSNPVRPPPTLLISPLTPCRVHRNGRDQLLHHEVQGRRDCRCKSLPGRPASRRLRHRCVPPSPPSLSMVLTRIWDRLQLRRSSGLLLDLIMSISSRRSSSPSARLDLGSFTVVAMDSRVTGKERIQEWNGR
jgi:hypothetical protein